MPKEMFLDLETTGFSPDKNQIIEIALKMDGKSFSTYLNPDVLVWSGTGDKSTLAFHQKTTPDILDRIKSGIEGEELEKALCLFLKECGMTKFSEMKDVVFIAHNGEGFDFKFIKKHPILSKYLVLDKVFDTLKHARANMSFKNGNALGNVAEELGITVKTSSLHTAIYDTDLLEAVYKEMMK